jgi:hypothetical protein
MENETDVDPIKEKHLWREEMRRLAREFWESPQGKKAIRESLEKARKSKKDGDPNKETS